MTSATTQATASPAPSRSRVAISPLWIVLAVDALLTLPFVFHGSAEMDTLRYALDLHRWLRDEQPLRSLFNSEMSFGYYVGLAVWQQVFQPALEGLPDLLNRISALFGIVCVGALYLWWRRWWTDRIASCLALLLVSTPAFWSLHLYGNTNIVGFALAAVALAVLPGRESGAQRTRWIAAWVFGTLALTIRTDILMLAPAALAFLIWGRDRPERNMTAAVGAACVLSYALLRLIALGLPTGGGSVFRHWSSNTNLGDLSWIARTATWNVASVFTQFPPLTLLASLMCFLAARNPGKYPMRWSTLLWIAPAVLFVFFGRVHLSRILLPLLPGALLPLAFWASRTIRRGLLLLAIVVVSHVSMLALPAIEDRIQGRSRDQRASHYVSHLGMFGDHFAIQEDTRELMTDAEDLVRSQGDGRKTVVVIGDDVLAYQFALFSVYPEATVATVFQSEGVALRVADVPGWEHRWYFLHPRWDRDPEVALTRGEVPPDALRHSTPWERRARTKRSP